MTDVRCSVAVERVSGECVETGQTSATGRVRAVRGLAVLLLVAAGATGCGAGNFGSVPITPTPIVPVPTPPASPPPYTGPTFNVTVVAGATPLVGAAVQFYYAGTTGNGSTATALLSASVTTNAAGLAAVPANYTCPATTGLTYLKASGGTLGSSTVNNTNVALMAAVGPCSSVTAGSSFTVNEVTTVAAAYALQEFYTLGQIGASSTNLSGLTNAFATAATLANATTGSSSGTTMPPNGVAPTARINALANMLNACVVKSSVCGTLYYNTPGGAPANTLDAMVNIARYPGIDVAGLYGLSQSSLAYGPGLGSAPQDWTVFVSYSGGGLSSPAGLALDSQGNVWVASYFYAASKFSPIGTPLFASGVTGYGLNNSYGMAVDLADNAWVPNEQPYIGGSTIGSLTVLSTSGGTLNHASDYTAGGYNYPLSVALDPNGTAWVVDYGNSHLTLVNAQGVPLSGSTGYTTPLFAFPVVVALDGNHFGWIGNQADTTVTKVAADGSSFQNFSCCNGASGIAIDQGNNVWVANFYGNSVSLISSTGQVISNGAYTGLGALDHPQGIAVDGAGNVFVASYRGNGALTELSGVGANTGKSISPAIGLGADAGLLEAFALAVDASGNVWVSNQGSNTITKFIGLAGPVKTPLSGLPKAP